MTGLTGFIGQALSQYLLNLDHSIVGYGSGFTQLPADLIRKVEWVDPRSSNAEGHLEKHLNECDVVVYLAAKVHQHYQRRQDLAKVNADYFRINTQATIAMADKAAKAGVKRFIFLSTIKVNGESTKIGSPFLNTNLPNPQGPYAISKWAAEVGLQEVSRHSGMEITIIRPPLVYGKNAKANIASLLKVIRLGIPLPFGSLDQNLRSFISIDNLISFIELCLSSDAAKNKTLLISDNQDMSTKHLILLLSQASNLKPRLFNCSQGILNTAFSFLGRKDMLLRLTDSLQLDVSKTLNDLAWHPPYSAQESFVKMCSR